VALYFLPDQDSQSIGLPDWYQYRYFGGLGVSPAGDNDSDSISNADELRAGLIPGIKDTFLVGGVSAASSAVVNIPLEVLWQFTVKSIPTGLVANANGYLADGQSFTTPSAPVIASSQYFSYWDVNGTGSRDSLGNPRNPTSSVLHADATYTANYYAPDQSAQCAGSGIPDWFQFAYFGSTCANPNSDPDGDGFTVAQELAAGLNPVVKDSFLVGGISAAGSAITYVDLIYKNGFE